MKDFKLIAYCNILYKGISSVIAQRLRKMLHKIVGDHQIAYVPGRQILDDILMMQELIDGYHKSSGKPRCMIKVDIMKAYDSMDWNFMWLLLQHLNFPPKFIAWIKACVTSAWFSISLNCSHHGFFPSFRGLRQGDFLSPYLFIIIMEFFDDLMKMAVVEPAHKFKFHPLCQQIGLTNICFADDLWILCSADNDSICIIKNVITKFGEATGLKPNLSKSSSRLVLINYVFFGIVNYWCQVVFLPDMVVKDIENIMRAFLWTGQTEGKLVHKVKWKTVVLPKKKGGLGVKSLHVQWRVGNGLNVNFLHDHWHNIGVLCDKLSNREVSMLRIRHEDSVASALNKVHWPRGKRVTEMVERCRNNMPTLNSCDDVVRWNGTNNFKSSNIWNTIRNRGHTPPWYRLIWFKGNV
ncbi:hypothetical protein LIER_04089 [Lithospermum erythrorhizon]|uniref:Reverse transcriptase domain-containing protein n=1 Tax=Lithospermum erythrorhizon TaxID=34254 RepID=A0AAV3NXE5_LITER